MRVVNRAQIEYTAKVGSALEGLADELEARLPRTRELAVVVTKLDEARLWLAELAAEHADASDVSAVIGDLESAAETQKGPVS